MHTSGISRASRRAALRLFVGGTITVLTACGPTAPLAPAATSVPPPAQPTGTVASAAAVSATSAPAKPAGQPKAGGTLRTALTADLPNLDPHINTTTAHENLFLAFDRIIQY